MEARLTNPATPETIQAIQTILKATREGGVPQKTLELVHLRVSQINGCSVCVDMSFHDGEVDRGLFAVAAWRDAPFFSDAERAALALSEALTRLSDRGDAVPDEIWDDARRHYDEAAMGALVLSIAVTNVWNRLNAATRQVAGEWSKSTDTQKWAAPQAV